MTVMTGKQNDFTVGDLLSKIADNYLQIRIEETINNVVVKRWVIPPHKKGTIDLPKKVLDSKVYMVVQYFSCLSIMIKTK